MLNEIQRESTLFIGCAACHDKHRHVKHPDYPAETGFTKDNLKELVDGYICPFCGEKFLPSPRFFKMLERFMNLPIHVKTIETPNLVTCDVYGIDTNIGYIVGKENQVDDVVQRLEEQTFESPEDKKLLFDALKDVDLHQWNIRLESGHHPEPLFRDDTMWFGSNGSVIIK